MSISRSTFLVAVVVASAVTSAAGADDLASAVAGKLSASQAVKGHKVNVRVVHCCSSSNVGSASSSVIERTKIGVP
jgi:hypothetical protein